MLCYYIIRYWTDKIPFEWDNLSRWNSSNAKYNNFGIEFECKPNTVHNLGYSISDANAGSSIVFVFTPFIQ